MTLDSNAESAAAAAVEDDWNEGNWDLTRTHLANIDLAIDVDVDVEEVDLCHNNNAADQLPVLLMASSDFDALWWSLVKLVMQL